MERVYRLLDSRFLSRIGNAETFVRVIGLGLVLLVFFGLVGAGVVDIAGSLPLVGLAVWALLAFAYLTAWATQRQPSTIASPLARTVVAKGLPRSPELLLTALATAESRARELIAEAAIMIPVNNHRAAADLAEACQAFEQEVTGLLHRQDELDERWLLLWEHQPSWVGPRLWQPLTKADLDVLGNYIALQARRLGYMIAFLEGGEDRPVRHIRAWVAADQRRAA